MKLLIRAFLQVVDGPYTFECTHVAVSHKGISLVVFENQPQQLTIQETIRSVEIISRVKCPFVVLQL